jgi:DNA repair exonuclease SbcCD nuclease subunit
MMNLKIFLTADIHIGMKFTGYPPDLQKKLIDARFETLKRSVDLANDQKCHLLIIAGDLFDKTSVSVQDIIKVNEILRKFDGDAVAVLPGNHDFISGDSSDIWSKFKENAADRVLILDKNKVFNLKDYDLDANLYSAPCESKHSDGNSLQWIKDVQKDKKILWHIGVAHGTLEGLAPDLQGKYYPISNKDLNEGKLDLWLLGHIHKAFPEKSGSGNHIFYPGTPEPDGFDCRHEGYAWIISMDKEKNIQSELKKVGEYKFLHDEIKIKKIEDLKRHEKKYLKDDYSKILLKLKLTGSLPKDVYEKVSEFISLIENKSLYLKTYIDSLTEMVTKDTINAEFTEGSFPHQLLMQLEKSKNPEILQMAYEIIHEAKQ